MVLNTDADMTVYPHRIYLEITRECPQQCLHCFGRLGQARENELTLNELKDLVRQMAEMGVKNLIISGGEPLVRPDIYEFLYFCAKNCLNKFLSTNGMLLNGPGLRAVRDTKTYLRISLDGISEETHDYIRGKGSFKKFLMVMSLIKEYKIDEVSINFTLNRINLKEILGLPCFLKDIGVRNITLGIIKPQGRAREHPELLIEPSAMPLVAERVRLISQSRNIQPFVNFRSDCDGSYCSAAVTKCGISADGSVTPCVFLGEYFRGGSIRRYPLKQLWAYDQTLQRIRNLEVNPACSSCSKFPELHGGCRARAAYFNNNDLGSPDPYCCQVQNQLRSNHCVDLKT